MLEFLVFVLAVLSINAIVLAIVAWRRTSRLESQIARLRRSVEKAPRPATDGLVACPLCGGMIRAEAKKCRHCLAFINVGAGLGEPLPPVRGTAGEPVEILPEAVKETPLPVKAREPSPSPAPSGSAGGVERMVGELVMSGLGVLLVVLGVALLLWWSWANMGALGKVILAGSTSGAMIVAGAVLEKRTRYVIPGGCLVAGGWAIAYATAYACHNVEAARVISSATVGFFVVLGVGAGAVLHAFRYRKEWVAGIAYGLLFLTFFIFRVENLALYALGPVALSLVVLVGKMRWIYVGTLGLTVLYVLLVLSGPDDPARSGIALVSLWAMMTVAQFLYRGRGDVERMIHSGFSFLNMAAFVGTGVWLLHESGLDQYWWLFASSGAVYVILSELSLRSESRGAYIVNIFGSAVLLCWALWRFLPDPYISLSWLALAPATLLYGRVRKQEIPRHLAHVILLAALFKTWGLDHSLTGTFPLGEWKISLRAIPAVVGALLLYGHAWVLLRTRETVPDEKRAIVLLPWIGFISLGCALAVFAPSLGVALLLSLAGLVLVETGRGVSSQHLRIQGFFLCLLAAGFVAMVNLSAEGQVLGISKRLVATIPVLGMWFYSGRRLDLSGPAGRIALGILTGCFLVGLLALLRFEIGAAGTPAAWALVAGAWLCCGMITRTDRLLMEGALVSLATVVHYASLSNPQVPLVGMGGPAVVGIPIAALLLFLHWWIRKGTGEGDRFLNAVRGMMTLAMSAGFFLVLARSVEGNWLTGSWALLAVGLAFYGFLVRDRMCRWTSLLVLAVCLGKLFLFDFPSFTMPVKIVTTISVGACMVAISIVYSRNRTLLSDYFTRE